MTFDELEQIAKGSDEKKQNEIAGYNKSANQYVLQSAGEITFVGSSELFEKVDNNEVVFINGIEGAILGLSISHDDDNEIFVREGTQMEAEKSKLSDFTAKHNPRYSNGTNDLGICNTRLHCYGRQLH